MDKNTDIILACVSAVTGVISIFLTPLAGFIVSSTSDIVAKIIALMAKGYIMP